MSGANGASKRVNGRASGPVITSLFLFVPDHSTVGVKEEEEEEEGAEEEEMEELEVQTFEIGSARTVITFFFASHRSRKKRRARW